MKKDNGFREGKMGRTSCVTETKMHRLIRATLIVLVLIGTAAVGTFSVVREQSAGATPRVAGDSAVRIAQATPQAAPAVAPTANTPAANTLAATRNPFVASVA